MGHRSLPMHSELPQLPLFYEQQILWIAARSDDRRAPDGGTFTIPWNPRKDRPS